MSILVAVTAGNALAAEQVGGEPVKRRATVGLPPGLPHANYGRPYSYDYRGPYYGGPYVGYWWRLPYACGVYGYC